MRPWLVAGLVASLALSGLAAWWPAPDDTGGLLPAAQTAGRVAGVPGPVAVSGPGWAPARPLPAAPAAATAATAATALTAPTAPTAAPAPTPATAATAATPAAATLPTRAADWPAPGAAALAAWQGAPSAQPAASASASASASAGPATPPLPEFPYQWIGQLDDGGAPQVLLASAQRSVGVRRGAVLDGRWRLDRAPGEPWKATHLPSGQTVAVRGAPPSAEP